MKWLKWDRREQPAGYKKFLVLSSKRFKFDCYIIKIPKGCSVPPHVHSVIEGYEQHRLNLMLTTPPPGCGKFIIYGPSKKMFNGKAVLFRPDLHIHEITAIYSMKKRDSMYVLSVGWATVIKK
jgi:hypothetical protein